MNGGGARWLLVGLLFCGPMFCGLRSARAEPVAQPAVRPTRDVAVTYSMVPGGRDVDALRQTARWDTADSRMRLDLPAPGAWMLIDYRARRMTMVSDRERASVAMPGGTDLPGEAPRPGAGGAYTRGGSDTVAGLGCTDWTAQGGSGHPVEVCITDDGVLLRARSGPRVIVLATRVDYGPQDPAAFAVPAGYSVVMPSASPPAAASSPSSTSPAAK